MAIEIRLQAFVEDYRIVAWKSAVSMASNPGKPDFEGAYVEFGDPAYLKCGPNDEFMANCDFDDELEEFISVLPEELDCWILRVQTTKAELEEVEEVDPPGKEAEDRAIAEIQGDDREDEGGEEEENDDEPDAA